MSAAENLSAALPRMSGPRGTMRVVLPPDLRLASPQS